VEPKETFIAGQRFGKLDSAATDTQATIEELFGTMLTVRSVQNGYKEELCKLFFQIKQQRRQGQTLGFAYLMPDCWQEVSLHPEGPATGQLDQGFPLVLRIHVVLHASHVALPLVMSKFRPNVAFPMLVQMSP
jgi:hypothetical protein